MIIVQGVFTVAPEDRDRYLAQSLETQRISRGEPGCIEYVLAADPVDSERVVLSERWATRADLDAHLAALRERRSSAADGGEPPVELISREVAFFEADAFELG